MSGVQSRVGGAQVAPEEQSPLDFMRENMGGFRVPTRVEEAVQNQSSRLQQITAADKSGMSNEEDMANQKELFGDGDGGETKGVDLGDTAVPDVVPSTTVSTTSTTALDTTLDTGADVAVDTGLGAVAAADAWNPIGWIIGAGLAIGAVTEAVGAVGDQAKATADQAMADSVKLPQQAPVNFAGSLVTPIQNSLARTQ